MSPRAKARPKGPALGKEVYEVEGPAPVPTQPFAATALVRAQDRALRETEPATFRVYRHPLFGQRVEMYRVVRDEFGNVTTFTVNRED